MQEEGRDQWITVIQSQLPGQQTVSSGEAEICFGQSLHGSHVNKLYLTAIHTVIWRKDQEFKEKQHVKVIYSYLYSNYTDVVSHLYKITPGIDKAHM